MDATLQVRLATANLAFKPDSPSPSQVYVEDDQERVALDKAYLFLSEVHVLCYSYFR